MPGEQVLGGLLAAAGLVAARPAGAIDLFDDRKVRDNGYDLIYEARDLDLPQATRDGFTQVRTVSLSCLSADGSRAYSCAWLDIPRLLLLAATCWPALLAASRYEQYVQDAEYSRS